MNGRASNNDPSTYGPAAHSLRLVIIPMTGVMGYTFSAVGPSMPLLREDLGIGRSLAGLHFTALAAGGLILGPTVDRIAGRFGRRTVFWIASWTLVAGGLLIGLGSHLAATLTGALIAGLGGTALLATGRSSLADVDRAAVARSIVANDTSWSFGALLPGIVVASLLTAGVGWRSTFLVPVMAAAFIFVRGLRHPFPSSGDIPAGSSSARRLPRPYWVLWAAFLPAAAGEWSTTAWIAGFMIDKHRMDADLAALMVTTFLAAMFAGRAVGTQLSRRFEPRRLMNSALALAVGGSVTLWRAGASWIAVSGLVICGLGVSLLAPMLITLSIAAAPGRTQTATARISLAASTAILSAPLTLGWLADGIGIGPAFGAVPLLYLLCWLLFLAGRHSTHENSGGIGS